MSVNHGNGVGGTGVGLAGIGVGVNVEAGGTGVTVSAADVGADTTTVAVGDGTGPTQPPTTDTRKTTQSDETTHLIDLFTSRKDPLLKAQLKPIPMIRQLHLIVKVHLIGE